MMALYFVIHFLDNKRFMMNLEILYKPKILLAFMILYIEGKSILIIDDGDGLAWNDIAKRLNRSDSK